MRFNSSCTRRGSSSSRTNILTLFGVKITAKVEYKKTSTVMKTLCSMSFSDSPLGFVHLVLCHWGVSYAIFMRHSLLKVTNAFIYIKDPKINEIPSEICASAATTISSFIDFCLPLASRSHSVINCRGNLCYYYVSVSVLAALNRHQHWMESLIGATWH